MCGMVQGSRQASIQLKAKLVTSSVKPYVATLPRGDINILWQSLQSFEKGLLATHWEVIVKLPVMTGSGLDNKFWHKNR